MIVRGKDLIEIVAGNHRDISYVVANLRQIDREEIFCQMDIDDVDLLAVLSLELNSRVCRLKCQPVAVFSFSLVNVSTVAVNLFGTNSITRAIPAITRFIFTDMIPDALQQGIRRFEARTIETHSQAHRWLEACGAMREGALEQMGKNGERFFMYALTKPTLDNMKPKRWQTNVLHSSSP
ncbi:MAG: hypothetical protein GY742_11235 [Hyphomicrobiales bacterium]|nr:hypothetical protein [Hyphomicrobiales bacterium]